MQRVRVWLSRRPPWALWAAAAVALALGFGSVAWSAARAANNPPATIGAVDLDRVATEYLQPALGEPLRQETARLQAQFDKEAAALDAELNEKVKGASDAEKQNLRNQYQQQKQALFARYQQQLDQRKQEMINQRLPKVKDAIGRVAARLGLEAVLDKNLVIWGGRDITDQVLLELGIKTSGSTEKPSSSSR